jgi:hypothetical protein
MCQWPCNLCSARVPSTNAEDQCARCQVTCARVPSAGCQALSSAEGQGIRCQVTCARVPSDVCHDAKGRLSGAICRLPGCQVPDGRCRVPGCQVPGARVPSAGCQMPSAKCRVYERPADGRSDDPCAGASGRVQRLRLVTGPTKRGRARVFPFTLRDNYGNRKLRCDYHRNHGEPLVRLPNYGVRFTV